VSNKLEKKSHDMKSGSEQELAGRIVEYASCQSALRSAGRSTEYEPLLSAVRECERRNRVSQWVAMAGLAIGGMSAQLTVVAVIMVTVQLSLSGSLDPVATVVFIGIALRFMRNLQDTVNFLVSTESSRVPLRDVHEILNAELLPVPSSSAELTNPGEVSVQNATFSYVPGTPVVRDVSFTAPPRTMTAIVGPSGSGKTTLFKLIARFWDVDSGTVRVGGTDVREQTTEQLMGQLSMVFQDVYLYDDTLIENIRVGREGATDDEALQAAQLAGCSEIAERLPQSWETRVGEGGGRLSGGERQRVSIARALLKNAPILLFDEATSALDPENEAGVQRSIRELRKHATVLVIAHKLDTVRDADQIIVLDEHGGISQVGTHDELVSAEGLYHRFWQARVDAAGWSLV
jgi:putative ABC transport system